MVTIPSERSDDEMHAMLHQATDEVHIAREAVESRDNQWAVGRLCLLKGCCESRSQQQRVRSRAGLHILVPGFDREAFVGSNGFDLVALRRETQPTAALFPSADPQVSDCCLHRETLPLQGVTIGRFALWARPANGLLPGSPLKWSGHVGSAGPIASEQTLLQQGQY